jgi:hypothetical protein
MNQLLPKLVSLSEHFLEDHTCIILVLFFQDRVFTRIVLREERKARRTDA